jgi:hypothetical protein
MVPAMSSPAGRRRSCSGSAGYPLFGDEVVTRRRSRGTGADLACLDVDRVDWLVLFLAAGARRPVAPVRVQKGLFLLAKSSLLPASERYGFEPYNYGPMSRELYRDVRRLCGEGVAEIQPRLDAPDGRTWRAVALTPSGRRRAAVLEARARGDHPEALLEVASIRARVDGLSFTELLTLVYDRYPEYASRSVFRRP